MVSHEAVLNYNIEQLVKELKTLNQRITELTKELSKSKVQEIIRDIDETRKVNRAILSKYLKKEED